jgi:hypothetical protein
MGEAFLAGPGETLFFISRSTKLIFLALSILNCLILGDASLSKATGASYEFGAGEFLTLSYDFSSSQRVGCFMILGASVR